LAPQGQFLVKNKNKKKHVAPHLGCHVSVDRVKIDFEGQNCRDVALHVEGVALATPTTILFLSR